MSEMKELFDEMLDQCYKSIELGGEMFAYSHVFKEVYPDAYEEDYDTWLAIYKRVMGISGEEL